jgi:hypothetical protein
MRAMQGEKFQRAVRYQKRHRLPRKRKIRRNHHHLTNAVNGGKSIPSNLLSIKIERHATIHRYFRNMSWEEIGDALHQMFGLRDPLKCVEVINRISRLKGRT